MQNRQHERPWWWTPQQESMAQDRQVYELIHRINKEQRDSQQKDKQRELRQMNHCPQQTQPLAMEGNLNLPSANIHQPPQSNVSVSVARDIYAAAKARNDRLHAELRQRIYYDPSSINVSCTDPRPSLPPDPWLRTSHSPQAQQTQSPFNLPAREASIANTKSLERSIDNDQCDMVEVRSAEARIRLGWLGINLVNRNCYQVPFVQRQVPLEHIPCAEHRGSQTRTAQILPCQPSSHTQCPDSHVPCGPQSKLHRSR